MNTEKDLPHWPYSGRTVTLEVHCISGDKKKNLEGNNATMLLYYRKILDSSLFFFPHLSCI